MLCALQTMKHEKSLLCFLVALIAILVRWCVSLNYYSGFGKPPMYGDYEAQRHWMEITFNLPIRDWYNETKDNELLYWGLDYPPLTAYHSWILGYISDKIDPSWISLHTSRGHESYSHKLFMRYSVMAADALFYIPAIIMFVLCTSKLKSIEEKMALAFTALMSPGLILIDHGHFQYNCISLGLALWAVIGLSKGYDLLASVAFCLALNYKQMELYHAMPFFCYLLGRCLYSGCLKGLIKLVSLVVTVLGSCALCWWPYLHSIDSIFQVVNRLFPFSRGLYEDKVANVWCSLSVVIKLKDFISRDYLILICFLTTLVFLLPSCIDLLLSPDVNKFLLCMVNSSMIFFLFSFQVHEKSILLVCLPVCLLLHERPLPCMWFITMATFSIFPLLLKDGLLLPYIALLLAYPIIVSCNHDNMMSLENTKNAIVTVLFCLSMLGCITLSVAAFTIKPPKLLPDLWPVLISGYSCVHFIGFLIYFHWWQLTSTDDQDSNQNDANETKKTK